MLNYLGKNVRMPTIYFEMHRTVRWIGGWTGEAWIGGHIIEQVQ